MIFEKQLRLASTEHARINKLFWGGPHAKTKMLLAHMCDLFNFVILTGNYLVPESPPDAQDRKSTSLASMQRERSLPCQALHSQEHSEV